MAFLPHPADPFEQRDNRTKMTALVGIGAGFVSALLFAVVVTGSPLAILLSYVAPMPIFIAAMGWRHQAGLVASLAGAVAIAVALKLSASLTFAIGIALPAWWIAYLALLGRIETGADGQETTQWYPLGRLLMWISVISALITLAGAVAIGGDHDTYVSAMRKTLRLVLNSGIPGMGEAGSAARGPDLDGLADMLAPYVPLVAGASFVPMIAANLWMAAKVTRMSGRLVRPWPLLPATQMPREAVVMLAVSLAGFAVLPGFAGLACGALLGGLVTCFFMTGLAAIHAMTFGKPWRSIVLVALYFALFIILTLALPVLALFGVADSLFNLRNSQTIPVPPPSSPSTN
jgi:hypothetical protein